METAIGTALGERVDPPVPVVPVLRSPFPSRTNRYAEEAERRALRWARRTGLIDPAHAAGLAAQRFGQLAGRCHPDLGLARLADVCRWYVWFAVLDDRYCDRPEPTADGGRLSQRLAVLSRAIGDPATPTTDPVAAAAADLIRRTRPRATDEQYRRLVLGF